MNTQLLAEKIVKNAIKLGADEAEVYLETNRNFNLTVRNQEVENIKQATSNGLGLRLYKEKREGFSYTSDLSAPSLDAFVKRAVQLTLIGEPRPWNGLADFEKGDLKNLDLYDPSIPELPNEKKLEIAKKVEKIAMEADKRITQSSGGYFNDGEKEILMVNSKGLSRWSKETSVNFGVGVIAGEGNNMQSGYWNSSKRHFKDLEDIEKVAIKAVQRGLDRLGAKPVPTQKVPVLFEKYTSGGFWRGVLSAMSGEGAYRKTSFLTDYLDKPIASPAITLIDDPTIPRHVASVPFDGEGKVTQKNTLIEKGILKMFIYDTISARKAGVKANTTSRRYGHRYPPYASTLNVILQNGSTPLEKILAGIKEGFYVRELRGQGTDYNTGNYSCGAAGFWIKNGELAFPVDGVTLGGNVIELMKNIEVLADDLEIRGGINSPSFKIAEITVGGLTG